MNKPYKQKVSVSLDEDIITEIKQLTENDDRSFSQYINLVLREHITKNKTLIITMAIVIIRVSLF